MSGGEKKKGLGDEHPEPLSERRTVVFRTAAWIGQILRNARSGADASGGSTSNRVCVV
jgi:hypothetical protein